MIKYDSKNGRLVVYERKASRPEFWDALWESTDFRTDVMRGAKNYWLKRITKAYLKPKAVVLEGGCGRGQNVYGLSQWGYDAYGIDFAFETVVRTQSLFPDLKISDQDVRHTNFPDNFFDGYWSLGVIEHFWEGYDDILKEAARIIKPGGYLFMTFPWISPLRRKHIAEKKYPPCDGDCEYQDDFYQFILSDDSVVRNAEAHGFRLVKKEAQDALKGMKYDRPSRFLQYIYDQKGFFGRALRYAISLLFKRHAGHIRLCVFKKQA